MSEEILLGVVPDADAEENDDPVDGRKAFAIISCDLSMRRPGFAM